MSESYEPTLVDVAKLLASTGGSGPNPEVIALLHWLVDQVPELRELWASANEVRHQGMTLLDLVRLRHCLVDEVESDQAYGTAAWLLRQVPETRALYDQLEQLGQDAGQVLQYRSFAVDVLRQHHEVDRLLADTSWTSAAEQVDVLGIHGVDYEAWISIVEARLARNEGDVERLRAVRDALRAEAELDRSRPALEELVKPLKEALAHIAADVAAGPDSSDP